MLVVVLVLENPDRFAIRLTEQINCRTSVSFRSLNHNAPRRARRRGRGRFQISEFGFKWGLRTAVHSRPSAATSASHSAWISCSMSAGLVTVRPISSRRIAAYCLRNR